MSAGPVRSVSDPLRSSTTRSIRHLIERNPNTQAAPNAIHIDDSTIITTMFVEPDRPTFASV